MTEEERLYKIDSVILWEYKKDLEECQSFLCDIDQGENVPSCLVLPCFDNINKEVEALFRYVRACNDVELCRLMLKRREKWLIVQAKLDLQADKAKCLLLLDVMNTLNRAHDWYLEDVCHIPHDEVTKYFVHDETLEVMTRGPRVVTYGMEYAVLDERGKIDLKAICGEIYQEAAGAAQEPPEARKLLHATGIPCTPTGSLNAQSRQTAGQEQPEAPELPDRLNTEKAKQVFARAVETGLMQVQEGRYKWARSNALLAYMCGRLYCGDEVVYDMPRKDMAYKHGVGYFPETALQQLFVGVTRLAQTRAQMKKRGSCPKSYKEIDVLFQL